MTEPTHNAEYVATVGSLFSGIGGIDLGLERAGFRVIWQSEVNPYASTVLAKHWPDVPNLGDITKIDWSDVERPDILAGGFPCQPVSHAGKRRAQEDERWLWPEFARAIGELRPRYALMENVPGLLTAGMGDVLGDLAALGYDTEWESLPAQAFGAPHLRYRIVIVAYANGQGSQGHRPEHQLREARQEVTVGRGGHLADAVRPGRLQLLEGQAGCRLAGVGAGDDPAARRSHREILTGGRPADSGWWTTEPGLGRVAHGIPARVDRLRCLGNAVVPQMAEWVGRRLAAHIDGGEA